jgi:hypothetical protein
MLDDARIKNVVDFLIKRCALPNLIDELGEQAIIP